MRSFIGQLIFEEAGDSLHSNGGFGRRYRSGHGGLLIKFGLILLLYRTGPDSRRRLLREKDIWRKTDIFQTQNQTATRAPVAGVAAPPPFGPWLIVAVVILVDCRRRSSRASVTASRRSRTGVGIDGRIPSQSFTLLNATGLCGGRNAKAAGRIQSDRGGSNGWGVARRPSRRQEG